MYKVQNLLKLCDDSYTTVRIKFINNFNEKTDFTKFKGTTYKYFCKKYNEPAIGDVAILEGEFGSINNHFGIITEVDDESYIEESWLEDTNFKTVVATIKNANALTTVLQQQQLSYKMYNKNQIKINKERYKQMLETNAVEAVALENKNNEA